MDIRLLEEEKHTFTQKRAFEDGFVLPDYDSYNIKNIKSLIGKIYGVGSIGSNALPNNSLDDFSGINKVLLVIVDGF